MDGPTVKNGFCPLSSTISTGLTPWAARSFSHPGPNRLIGCSLAGSDSGSRLCRTTQPLAPTAVSMAWKRSATGFSSPSPVSTVIAGSGFRFGSTVSLLAPCHPPAGKMDPAAEFLPASRQVPDSDAGQFSGPFRASDKRIANHQKSQSNGRGIEPPEPGMALPREKAAQVVGYRLCS